jgi:hypothetical protein
VKTSYYQNNFNYGEISPRAMGRFDPDRPLWRSAVAEMTDMLGLQLGGATRCPGRYYVATTKTSSKFSRLIPFQYSREQTYLVEVGEEYMRFFANGGVVLDGASPEEIVTTFQEEDLSDIQYAQNFDTMYLTHGDYPTKKLTRLTATTFSIADVTFVRGPFMDDNITATTITPSSATGNTNLVASSAIFNALHVGSLWKVNAAVVKITAFTDSTHVAGTVQAEPDGSAGNIGGTAAYTAWAEGSFSDYRGWPVACCFHEGRLYYAKDQTLYGSVVGAYDNFDKGAEGDSDAVQFKIDAHKSISIIWITSDRSSIVCGTEGGTVSAYSGNTSLSITPTNPPNISFDTDYSVSSVSPVRISGRLIYLQKNSFQLREVVYSLENDQTDSEDMNILADHILREAGGGFDMARQQSPNDRIWIVCLDGTMVVLTRNAKQEIMGWCRVTAGETAYGRGAIESVAIIPQTGADDQIWTITQYVVDGSVVRYVEYFAPEIFDDDFDAMFLDCALTLDNPKTITGATKADPVVITAASHGFSNGDQVRIDNVQGMTELNRKIYLVANKDTNTFELTDTDGNDIDGTEFSTYRTGGEVRKMVTAISGLDHLEGEEVTVQVDGGLPAGTQVYTVSSGAITLAHKAGVVHVGLPKDPLIKLLPLNDGLGPMKTRRIYLTIVRLYRSMGFKVGFDLDDLYEVVLDTPDAPKGLPIELFTGDKKIEAISGWDTTGNQQLILTQDQPLPLTILAVGMRSETEEK